MLPDLPLSSDGDVNEAVIMLQLTFLSLFISSFALKKETQGCKKTALPELFSQGTPTMKIL